jgi:hypothetical protein
MTTFADFLLRNSVLSSGSLPLVHTTRAYHLREIQQKNLLEVSDCDVFVGEKLNYFFVGRPGYKFSETGGEGAYWEFPCCFIFDFSAVGDPRRIFPFDSGAFRKGKYPNYIKMMKMEDFDVAEVTDAPARIIGAFFGSPARYFQLQAKAEEQFIREYSLGVMDAELRALHRLATDKSDLKFDDRRFCIEVQGQKGIDLSVSKPLAVVAPSDYFDDSTFRRHITEKWEAEPIPYPIYPLSVSNAYAQIYERVHEFYKTRGLL